MPEMSARAAGPRRSVSWCAVATFALLLVVACDDNDALRGSVSGGDAGASAGGVANAGGGVASAGAPTHAGASGASLAGTGGSAAGEAGAGGASSPDAGAGGESEAGAGDESEGGASGEPSQDEHCESGGALFLAGNYVDTAGNRLLLRSAPKAATFAIVPSGAASPAKLPQLFQVDRLCAPGGALIAKDGSSSYRVDFVQTGLRFAVCISTAVATPDAASALPPADSSHSSDTGCSGKPFTVYTAEAL